MVEFLLHHVVLDLGVLDLQPMAPLDCSQVLPLQGLMLSLQIRVLLPEIIKLVSQTLNLLQIGCGEWVITFMTRLWTARDISLDQGLQITDVRLERRWVVTHVFLAALGLLLLEKGVEISEGPCL